jgi:hypothetical protein
MLELSRNGYTSEEVRKYLHGASGSRIISFRYDLLDKNENKKGELELVSSGEVSMSAFSEIKRTARFTLRDQEFYTKTAYTWGDVGASKWTEL